MFHIKAYNFAHGNYKQFFLLQKCDKNLAELDFGQFFMIKGAL